jgi:PAS domain S-box-containing protein
LCHFYETSADLFDMLVPYYAEGLRAHDCGVWVTSEPFAVEQASKALAQAVPDLDDYLASGQMIILSYEDWRLRRRSTNTSIVQDDWLAWTDLACQLGFRGLRASGNAISLQDDPWRDLIACERRQQEAIGEHRMISLCAYPLAGCTAAKMLDVVRVHDCAIARRSGVWESVESTPQERVEQALQRHAEKAIRENEERFRTMLDTSPDGIARLALDGRILLANRQAALLFGFESVDQMLAYTRYIFDMLATEDHSRVREGIRNLANVNIRREALYCGVRRDGSRFPAEVDVSMERSSAGEPRAMIVVLRDVGERTRAEQELQEERAEAVAANQATTGL